MRRTAVDHRPQALLIRDRWVGLILSGQKTWEMRKKPTRIRGMVALIRIGSGLVVGTADLVHSLEPLTEVDFAANVERHCINHGDQAWAIANGYRVAWVLKDARRLSTPVPYVHNNQQMWVRLHDDVAASIRAQGHALGNAST